MLSQQQIEAIILYHLYGESEAAAKRFREAVTNAAKEIAAQQSVQRTGGESAANLSLFPAEVESPAKVTRKSTRR